jgi:DNA-binding beta-propeller fold protein YncE
VKVIDLKTGARQNLGDASEVHDYVQATADHHFIYLAQQFLPEIRAISVNSSSSHFQTIIRGSKTHLKSPFDIVFSPDGRLCVADHDLPQIDCFSPQSRGNASPVTHLNLSRHVKTIDALAFDGQNHLVISGTLHGRAGIAVFDSNATGNPSPLKTIEGPKTGLVTPYYLAVDSRGAIYVLNDEVAKRTLYVFGAAQRGDVIPLLKFSESELPVANPLDIAFDRSSNSLIMIGLSSSVIIPGGIRTRAVPTAKTFNLSGEKIAPGLDGSLAISNGSNTFTRFSIVHGRPAGTFTANFQHVQLHDPDFVSVASDGTVYFASVTGNIERFAARARGDAKPLLTENVGQLFNQGDSLVNGFAGDSSGYTYFSRADRESIEVHEPSSRKYVISGPRTAISGPRGITVDANRSLYVTNMRGNSVTVYAADARGNTAPVRVIGGTRTGLGHPQSVAVDSDGTVYVFYGPLEQDGFSHPIQHVAVFPPKAAGNIAPAHVYPVKAGCFTNDSI